MEEKLVVAALVITTGYVVLWFINLYSSLKVYRTPINEGGCLDPNMKRPGILLCAAIALALPATRVWFLDQWYRVFPSKPLKWDDVEEANPAKPR